MNIECINLAAKEPDILLGAFQMIDIVALTVEINYKFAVMTKSYVRRSSVSYNNEHQIQGTNAA